MLSNIVISVRNLTKVFKSYDQPIDRLKQSIFPTSKKKYYREFCAVNNVSFDVPRGHTIGIVGRNGSGKSTLLQMIAGTLKPSSGNIKVSGRVAALLELGSGFNPEYTGRENVYMNGTILGLSRNEIDAIFDEIVDFAEIGNFIDQPIKAYSSGMALRLAFAVQAMVPKEILIVDEALAVGDELFQRKCFAKIEDFKGQGGTILFVSHSGSVIVELCDSAILLDAGESIMIGPSKSVINLYQKYMYAPHEKKEIVKNEILLMNTADFNQSVADAPDSSEGSMDPFNGAQRNVLSTRKNAMYEPSLVPKETVRYECRGAKIIDAEITTLSGKKVNILLPDETYIWRYNVEFYRRCQNVRFGMLIKNSTGFELGGANNVRAGQGLPFVEPGTVLKVEFTFKPALNSGMYFMNGGVLGLEEEGEVYLDRGIDLAVFKILPDEECLSTAVVNFDVVSDVVKV